MSELVRLLQVSTRRVAWVVRPEPLDATCAVARSRQRLHRAALTAGTAALARGVSMLGILISVPLTVRYLGQERYGLWMTITSLLALLSFADLGLGIGLLNVVAHADGKEDCDAAEGYISSAFFMLTGVALFILATLAVAYPLIPWARLFNVTSPRAVAEAGPAAAAFAACFAVGLPLSVVQRVQFGYQEGGLVNLWSCLGSVLSLLGLLLAVQLGAGLPWLVVAVTGLPQLAWAVNSLVYFGLQRPEVWPQWSKARPEQARFLFSLGLRFFILNLLYLLAFGLDNFIIAGALGNEAVASYSVCVKYFSVSLVLVNLISSSLWAAYGEAFARQDWDWLRKVLWRSLRLSLLISGGAVLALVVVSRPAIRVWAGPANVPSLALACGMGLWVLLDMVRVTLSTFFNALNIIWFQTVVLLSFTLLGLGAKFYLVRAVGVEGMVYGSVLVYLLVAAVPMFWYAHGKTLVLGREREQV
jgi:O-antigen/teichoic acid export membrane protein